MERSSRNSRVDDALLELRSLILGGAFEASARLPEVALSERLGISRTPLRQAMDRLVAEGLLDRLDTGGCRVASFTREDITDAIELRGVIEGTAARLAAERGTDPAHLREAAQVLDGIDTALARPGGIDFDAYVRLNARFHDLLSRMPGSALIRRETERVGRMPLASPSAFLHGQELVPDFRASLALAQGQHRAILEAIGAREGSRAEALAREHARLARRNLDYVTRDRPNLAARIPGLSLVSAT